MPIINKIYVLVPVSEHLIIRPVVALCVGGVVWCHMNLHYGCDEFIVYVTDNVKPFKLNDRPLCFHINVERKRYLPLIGYHLNLYQVEYMKIDFFVSYESDKGYRYVSDRYEVAPGPTYLIYGPYVDDCNERPCIELECV